MEGEICVVYFTGDIHGSPYNIIRFAKRMKLTRSDVIVILGDVGANYYGNDSDDEMKLHLNAVKPTVLCIHGNHEKRPATIPSYKLKEWNGGQVWFEELYPKILFAKDGEIYSIDGIRYLVIGGAYSVDKYYRLMRGYGWWEDEQPSAEIKAYVEKRIAECEFDVILSHTCPMKYEPVEMFITQVDQSTVDTSTEEWLDSIEEQVNYKAWFCGHWHADKRIDRIHFLYNSFESADMIGQAENESEDE